MQLFPSPKASNKDALIGAIGAAFGMAITWLVCDALLDSVSPILALSMGASAVILFTMPHAPAAQPVPLILAHCVAAFWGVLSAQLIDNSRSSCWLDGSFWLHASAKWWHCVNCSDWW
jgi:CBS domain-containing membrane protein